MPEQQAPPKTGTFCWTELVTPDVDKAKRFYTELIGWTTSEMPMGEGGTYTMLHPPGTDEPVGGIMAMEGEQWEGIPPHWMPYILVEDVDASARRVVELGGKVKVEPMDIPNIGRFCVIADPTGAVISLFCGPK